MPVALFIYLFTFNLHRFDQLVTIMRHYRQKTIHIVITNIHRIMQKKIEIKIILKSGKTNWRASYSYN